MKRKIFTHLLKYQMLLLFVLLLSKPLMATNIVGYSLNSSGAATSGVAINFPSLGRAISTVGVTSGGYNSSYGQSCYGWNSIGGDYWETNGFSTAVYENIVVVGQMKAVTGGPQDFIAMYSVNGTDWYNVPNDANFTDDNPLITLTTSLASFKFRLPSECNNKSAVYVRWVQNSAIAVGGGAIQTGPSYTASLKAVVVQADLLIAPTSQSTSISIASTSATTISITCTPGGGDRRIVKMMAWGETAPTWTAPYDDYNPTANSTYSSGEQVVYNGSDASVTVTVPSSTNSYWFIYYEYNVLDDLTRYCLNNESENGNPKRSALESIHSPTYSFGLISSTLGATISEPTVGTIADRGVFWSTSPGVTTTNSSRVSEYGTTGGLFTLSTTVDRGSTIYFKGFAENEFGIILSEEASFSNVPVFTGTGTWETAARWNVNEVPGLGASASVDGSNQDSPIIQGTCTLTSDITCKNLTVASSGILNVNVGTGIGLKSIGTTTLQAPNCLVLKSSSLGNASFIDKGMAYETGGSAKVELFLTSCAGFTGDACWHYVSSPVTNAVSGVFLGDFLRWYNTATPGWSTNYGQTTYPLSVMKGFAVSEQVATGTPPGDNHYFTGELNTEVAAKSLLLTGATGVGFNLIGNPYPSAIDIESNGIVWTNVSTKVWYLQKSSGSYMVYLKGGEGQTGNRYIPSMQGFFVYAYGSSPSITFPNASRVHDNFVPYYKEEHATSELDVLYLKAQGNGKESYDLASIVLRDYATRNFDEDHDAQKMYGNAQSPQLYSLTDDSVYLTINAFPFAGKNVITTVPVCFTVFENGTGAYSLTASNLVNFRAGTKITLEDKKIARMQELNANPVYTFNYTEGDDPARFLLHFDTYANGINDSGNNNDIQIYSSGSDIFVKDLTGHPGDGEFFIFNMIGQEVLHQSFASSVQCKYTVDLPSGYYIVRVVTQEKTYNSKIHLD